MAHKQAGMTMWGMAVVLALIAFFVLLGLKLTPPYLEFFKVKSILQSMKQQAESASREELIATLQKRFDIDDVNGVDPKNDMTIENRGRGTKVVRIAYEVRVPLAYNVSALLDFDSSIEVRGVE